MSKRTKFRPRTPGRFRKTEVRRAAAAAVAAGLNVQRIEVDPATGKINVVVGKPDATGAEHSNEWDAAVLK